MTTLKEGWRTELCEIDGSVSSATQKKYIAFVEKHRLLASQEAIEKCIEALPEERIYTRAVTEINPYLDGINDCRSQTLANLEKLKKNV